MIGWLLFTGGLMLAMFGEAATLDSAPLYAIVAMIFGGALIGAGAMQMRSAIMGTKVENEENCS